jgi:hypothetical protein
MRSILRNCLDEKGGSGGETVGPHGGNGAPDKCVGDTPYKIRVPNPYVFDGSEVEKGSRDGCVSRGVTVVWRIVRSRWCVRVSDRFLVHRMYSARCVEPMPRRVATDCTLNPQRLCAYC